MSTAVVDGPKSDETLAWWFLDLLVVEHRSAPGMTTVVLEMTLPVGSSAPLHVHDTLDDTWFVLDGDMVVRCGDDQRGDRPGPLGLDARGAPHLPRGRRSASPHPAGARQPHVPRPHPATLWGPRPERTLPPQPEFPAPDELAVLPPRTTSPPSARSPDERTGHRGDPRQQPLTAGLPWRKQHHATRPGREDRVGIVVRRWSRRRDLNP